MVYQNILDFEYYVNIFQPDCIVFDAAEYTFSNEYFDYQKMLDFKLNPLLACFKDYETRRVKCEVTTENGETLTKIKVADTALQCEYAYMTIGDNVYDMRKRDDINGNGYWEVTVTNEQLDLKNIQILWVDTYNQIKYVMNVR